MAGLFLSFTLYDFDFMRSAINESAFINSGRFYRNTHIDSPILSSTDFGIKTLPNFPLPSPHTNYEVRSSRNIMGAWSTRHPHHCPSF